MHQLSLSALTCWIMIGSSISLHWAGHKPYVHTHFSHFPQPSHRHDYNCKSEHEGVAPEYGLYNNHGCACLYYVDTELVYQRENTTTWHSCSGWGLYRCYQHCNEMHQDENVRYRIHQNACDTLGREIHTHWYRRHQVCGPHGPYEDFLLEDDPLCCRRGRPSDNC